MVTSLTTCSMSALKCSVLRSFNQMAIQSGRGSLSSGLLYGIFNISTYLNKRWRHTVRNAFRHCLALSLSFTLGGTESSRSYMIWSEFDVKDFARNLLDEVGTTIKQTLTCKSLLINEILYKP